MKKAMIGILLAVSISTLCACGNKNSQSFVPGNEVPTFKYSQAVEQYKEGAEGVKVKEFKNDQSLLISKTQDVLDLAKREASVKYDTMKASYDAAEKIWCVSLHKKDSDASLQNIYIDSNGKTIRTAVIK